MSAQVRPLQRKQATAQAEAAQAPREPVTDAGQLRRVYLVVLTWAFTLLSSLRALSYLPTLWAIVVSGDSSQHSLWTWGTWLGANLTMAAWLYEQQGQALTRAVMVNLVNAAMCGATVTVILAVRL